MIPKPGEGSPLLFVGIILVVAFEANIQLQPPINRESGE
jgi:hypothetical protein